MSKKSNINNALAQVSIRDNGIGCVQILLDGQDVTRGCKHFAIKHDVGTEVATLTLCYNAMDIEVDGICTIESAAESESHHENP